MRFDVAALPAGQFGNAVWHRIHAPRQRLLEIAAYAVPDAGPKRLLAMGADKVIVQRVDLDQFEGIGLGMTAMGTTDFHSLDRRMAGPAPSP
ncbi:MULTISPECIES: hypothetical protein [unclassified Variovorax]|uniref:hypothetical protein n=1 Tax=Variovorax sp. WDL1 TaxID=207745 RepID=UPI000ACA9CFD